MLDVGDRSPARDRAESRDVRAIEANCFATLVERDDLFAGAASRRRRVLVVDELESTKRERVAPTLESVTLDNDAKKILNARAQIEREREFYFRKKKVKIFLYETNFF